jgi:hypothetical protein
MASRDELARTLAQLAPHAAFGDYVKTLTARRDAVVAQCLNAPTMETAEPFRLEARAYDRILADINNNRPQR